MSFPLFKLNQLSLLDDQADILKNQEKVQLFLTEALWIIMHLSCS